MWEPSAWYWAVAAARSTGGGVYEGVVALCQWWLFWVAPIAGAALGALVHRLISAEE
ncbi:MAG: hypothetical protein ACK5HY_10900 [Parahaliea sp.]